MSWDKDQEFESGWWGDCSNTWWEEQKQFVYAGKMGIGTYMDKGKIYYDLKGLILDIGGGPVSMLLKSPQAEGVVADPCPYPKWVMDRYKAAGIEYIKRPGEEEVYPPELFDEVIIYNVLQHTMDPELIANNALASGKIVRVFEWIDMPPSEGHPQELSEKDLNSWFGGVGKVEDINDRGCHGRCWYGIFKGKYYGK